MWLNNKCIMSYIKCKQTKISKSDDGELLYFRINSSSTCEPQPERLQTQQVTFAWRQRQAPRQECSEGEDSREKEVQQGGLNVLHHFSPWAIFCLQSHGGSQRATGTKLGIRGQPRKRAWKTPHAFSWGLQRNTWSARGEKEKAQPCQACRCAVQVSFERSCCGNKLGDSLSCYPLTSTATFTQRPRFPMPAHGFSRAVFAPQVPHRDLLTLCCGRAPFLPGPHFPLFFPRWQTCMQCALKSSPASTAPFFSTPHRHFSHSISGTSNAALPSVPVWASVSQRTRTVKPNVEKTKAHL